MRIVLAPDKFKGTFTAAQVCAHIASGVSQVRPDALIDQLPLADGGDGTLDLVLAARGGRLVEMQACGPLGETVSTAYGVTPDGTGVIESARICGLAMTPPGRRDVMRATSRGVGEVIAAALDAGIRRFVLGLGGTATVDGGAGMARGLGYRLLDRDGSALSGLPETLARIVRIDPAMAHQDLRQAQVSALCDVTIPLLGERGAASLFGPQKGASPAQVERLESGLAALSGAVDSWKQEAQDLATRAGAGAGGGVGFGVGAFLGGTLQPGAAWLLSLTAFRDRIRDADLVVTGEGRLDFLTGTGKVVSVVLQECADLGIRAAVVTGSWDGSPIPSPSAGTIPIYSTSMLPGNLETADAGALEALGRLVGQSALGPERA